MNLLYALLLAFLSNISSDSPTLYHSAMEEKTTKSFGNSYIDAHWPIADSLGKEYGIPPEVILSVAVIESGYGSSRNSKLLNNHFGIKGKNNLMKTHGIKTAYKQYPSVAEGYAGFCGLVSRKKFYPNLKGNTDPEAWIMAISKAGYSTKPEYWRSKVRSAVKKYFS